MALYLTKESALEFWRNQPEPVCGLAGAGAPKEPAKPSDFAELAAAGLSWLSRPIHTFCREAKDRRNLPGLVCHVCGKDFPRDSFIRLFHNIFVSSPELTCLSLASSFNSPLLAETIFEFCGSYRLPQGRTSSSMDAKPLTSSRKLKFYARTCRNARGAANLTRIMRYACDNSRSPMETDIAIALAFDPRMGGFGIPKPVLNPHIPIPGKRRTSLPQSYYSPDLYWPEKNVAIEYDSDEFHQSEHCIGRDAIRRNGMMHLGTHVVTLTWHQASKYHEFERAALILAKELGKKFGPGWDKWDRKRRELHRLLFAR
ncbi:MAG TPA: hypothetical protein H9823_02810 [Candidatus Rubneribacter avistercoris]|nr:hypothetical protein [Candidatus Rubneribacter avistercoris]